jgi:hypothetical protein
MKRWLSLLGLSLLLLASACSKPVELSVDALMYCFNTDNTITVYGPATYEGFAGKSLGNSDILFIFDDMRTATAHPFTTALLVLDVYDKISDNLLGTEKYEFFPKEKSRRGYDYRAIQ